MSLYVTSHAKMLLPLNFKTESELQVHFQSESVLTNGQQHTRLVQSPLRYTICANVCPGARFIYEIKIMGRM